MKNQKPQQKPLVISYLRFSSAPQEKGDSIRRQLEMSEKWAAKNGLQITESLRDLGISAYRGKNATEGALSAFIALVKAGKIPKGSILLVESLDRISRNEVRIAFQQFLEIINSGVTVVTVGDGYQYSADKCDMLSLMQSLMIYSRAREESENKTRRQKSAWAGKRERAAKSGEVVTSLIPTWCEIKDDKIVLIPEKAKIVKRIFDMCIKGKGINSICKTLNDEGVYLSKKVKYIQASVVSKLLVTKLALGEYQPTQVVYDEQNKRKIIPAGEPIPNYYPAVISEDTYYAAKKALASRKNHGGKVNHFVNLFNGLLFSYKDKSPMWVVEKRKGKKCYCSSASEKSLKGADDSIGCVAIKPFETGLLMALQGPGVFSVDTSEQLEAIKEKIASAEGQVTELESKIVAVQNALITQKATQSVSVLSALNQMDQKKAQLVTNIEILKGKLIEETKPSGDSLKDMMVLIAKVSRGGLDNEERKELQQQLTQFIERIEVVWQKDSFSYNVGTHIFFDAESEPLKLSFRLQWSDERKRTKKGYLLKGWTGYIVQIPLTKTPGKVLSIKCGTE